MTEPRQNLSPDIEDADVVLVAHAIAEHGVGRPWDDFLPVNAHDLDQGDLIEYARAAVDALRSSGIAQTAATPTDAMVSAGWSETRKHGWSISGSQVRTILEAALALPSSPAADGAAVLKTIANLFSESAHETWTKEEIVNIIEDAIRLRSPMTSTELAWRPSIDNPLKAYTVDQLQYEIALRASALTSTDRQPSSAKEATAAQHFDLPKGEPARFVRNGVLETCQCRDCSALSRPQRQTGEA